MHTIAEKNAKKDNKKPRREKKERPTRQLLQAVEEGERDGGDADDDVGKDRQNDDERGLAAFTQEHIAQMFEGELGEFACLTSCEVSRNQRQQQNLSGGGGSTRIQYLIENEISGDFFRVKSNNDSTAQRRKSLLFTSSMGASASRFSASLHFGKLEAAGGASSTWGSTGGCGGGLLLRDLETALVVMCQGILAGLCWMDAFNLSSSDGVIRKDTRDVFACTYSAVADRSRQLFFILFKYPYMS